MSGWAAFVLALPLCVYLWAGILGLIDGGNPVRVCLRLSLRLGLILLLLAMTQPGGRIWIAVAGLLVVVLHMASQLSLRYVIRSGRWPARRIE